METKDEIDALKLVIIDDMRLPAEGAAKRIDSLIEQAEKKRLDDTNPKDLLGVKKPPISLIPSAGLLHEAMAMKNGAIKYGPFNFREKKVQALIYADAAMRHLLAWIDGEEVAEDSGVHHLGHARACLSILLDAQECGNLIDNRPKPGAASRLIEALTAK